MESTGDLDIQIESMLQSIELDPGDLEHQRALRDLALKRTSMGGRRLGLFARITTTLPAKNPKRRLLNAERLSSYDPGNTQYLFHIAAAADSLEFHAVSSWFWKLGRKVQLGGRGDT